MRIFITGANGQLAKSFLEVAPDAEFHLATKKDLDVTNKEQVKKQIKEFRPAIVFHCASMTRGDECYKNPDMAHAINVVGTQNVVDACREIDAEILFVSTNEVFDGRKRSRYTEKDVPNPITVVGKTKYQAENIIKENLKKYYIVRTSWLYSNWSANFLHAVINKARKDKELQLVQNEVSSPTYSLDLANALKKLVSTKKYGIYHLSNIGIVSRLDFAKKAFEVSGIENVKIIPVKLAEYARLSKPPLFSPLKNTKAKALGITLPSWDDALKRYLISAKI